MILGYHPLCVCAQVLSLATPWTIAHQAPLSMEFYRQEYWSGLAFPSPGDLPNPRIQPTSLVSLALAVQFSHSIMSDSLWPHGLQHTRLSCPSPISGTCSNAYPSSQWQVESLPLSHLGSPLGYLMLCNLIVVCEFFFIKTSRLALLSFSFLRSLQLN